jgi:hypothetical protein
MKLALFNAYRSISRRGFYVILFILVISSASVFSQSGMLEINRLALCFDSIGKLNPREEVYIQTNKDIFETGEDLWFKAYLLNAQDFTPSSLSKTLYLQLISEKTGHAVWNEKYEIIKGFANGHVFLPDSLSEGNFFLAAYTGNSFFGDSAEITSLKRITVKKDMKPGSSLIADFNKVIYKTGDTIRIGLKALSEKKKPQVAQIEAELYQGKKSLGKVQAATNQDGKTNLYFVLQEKTGEGLRIEIKERYADLYNAREKTTSFAVPHKQGRMIEFNTFPEGGNLVTGIESNLAFKAVNIDGNPQDIAGTLFEGDKPLTQFKSSHAGMGSLRFTPFEGKSYSIRLSKPLIDSTFLLPEVFPQGIALQLTERDKDYLIFTVSQSSGFSARRVHLLGQMRGMVCCVATAKLFSSVRIKVPLKEFPGQGIAEMTLFDENLLPVAERLVYVDPERQLSIESKLDKDNYPVRGKVQLMIRVTDPDGKPVVSNIGVTVFDKLYQNPENQKNILTHYYLSSQLRGMIYEPTWYFDKKNKDKEQNLDQLLLTQGWRRYIRCEDNRGNRKPVISDGIEGEVSYTKKVKQAPKGGQFVLAFNPAKDKSKTFISADSTGRFTISPQHLKFWQGGYIYLKPLAPAEFEPRISLKDPFQIIDQIRKYKIINYPLSGFMDTVKEKSLPPYIERPGVIKLDEVIIKGHSTTAFRDKYLGHLDSLAKANFNDVYVCPHGYLHNYRKGYAHLMGDLPPYQLCDTVKIKPIEGKVYQLIKYEDVGRSDGRWILTKLFSVEYHNPYAKLTEEELLKMNNLMMIKAFYGQREFYQPKYDKEKEENLSFDTRNTLLWAPSVVTNEKGEASLEFYCSDINTGFVGKIEGVGGEGLLGTGEFEFHVIKNISTKE